jgi:septal ring factor EnvC (AmiA/AmiB activator)
MPSDPTRSLRRGWLSWFACVVAGVITIWIAGRGSASHALAGPEDADPVQVQDVRLPRAKRPPAHGVDAATDLTDREVRSRLAEHIGQQQQAVATAAASVGEKVDDARRQRAQRARLAYRITRLHDPAAGGMALVRSHAAVKWLLARDGSEFKMLLDEQRLLAASAIRLSAAALEVDRVALPPRELAWPAPGVIVRGFGPFEHERSGATLSRRGLDLEVEDGVDAHAVAAGTVVYAGPIRGLDHGVLIDHGSYYSLLAKLTDLTVGDNQQVGPASVLGRAARRRLYFELRVKLLPSGIPVDPVPFLTTPSKT